MPPLIPRNRIAVIRLRLSGLVCFTTFLVGSWGLSEASAAFTDSELRAEPAVVETRFVLENENTSPISDAYIVALQTRPREASQWYDLPVEFDQSKICVRTDALGKATLFLPSETFCSSSYKETAFARVQISHPEYQTSLQITSVDSTVNRVTLTRGCTVGYSAVDEAGQTIRDFGVRMAGKSAPQHWLPLPDGGLEAQSIPVGSWQTMLIQPEATGRTRFSDLFITPALPNRSLLLRNLTLKPGIEVRGLLSANVPRPIIAGQVLAVSLPRPAESVWDGDRPSLQWIDRVSINEDGTFLFPSMPRGGQLQLIAICEGWISATQDKNLPYVAGKVFAVDLDDLKVELEMQPLGTATVMVETEDGRPVANVQLSLSPQQLLWRGNTMLLGGYVRSVDSILSQRSSTYSIERPELAFPRSLYRQQSGFDGIVRFTNLPIDRSHFIDVYHHEFEHTGPELDRQRWLRISSSDSNDVVHRVVVTPRG